MDEHLRSHLKSAAECSRSLVDVSHSHEVSEKRIYNLQAFDDLAVL